MSAVVSHAASGPATTVAMEAAMVPAVVAAAALPPAPPPTSAPAQMCPGIVETLAVAQGVALTIWAAATAALSTRATERAVHTFLFGRGSVSRAGRRSEPPMAICSSDPGSKESAKDTTAATGGKAGIDREHPSGYAAAPSRGHHRAPSPVGEERAARHSRCNTASLNGAGLRTSRCLQGPDLHRRHALRDRYGFIPTGENPQLLRECSASATLLTQRGGANLNDATCPTQTAVARAVMAPAATTEHISRPCLGRGDLARARILRVHAALETARQALGTPRTLPDHAARKQQPHYMKSMLRQRGGTTSSRSSVIKPHHTRGEHHCRPLADRHATLQPSRLSRRASGVQPSPDGRLCSPAASSEQLDRFGSPCSVDIFPAGHKAPAVKPAVINSLVAPFQGNPGSTGSARGHERTEPIRGGSDGTGVQKMMLAAPVSRMPRQLGTEACCDPGQSLDCPCTVCAGCKTSRCNRTPMHLACIRVPCAPSYHSKGATKNSKCARDGGKTMYTISILCRSESF